MSHTTPKTLDPYFQKIDDARRALEAKKVNEQMFLLGLLKYTFAALKPHHTTEHLVNLIHRCDW